MPVQTSYPGVYVEERPSGVHTIVGVSTSVTAFVGVASMGPTGTPIRIRNVPAYHRQFGPSLDAVRPLGHAVEHFFANGGSEALIVRVAGAGAAAAKATLRNKAPADTLILDASSFGAWANSAAASGPGLVATVDYQASNPDDLFDLVLTQSGIDPTTGARVVGAQESFADLSMSPNHPSYVNKALAASALVGVDAASPAPGGTAKGSSTGGAAVGGTTVIGSGNNTLRISLDFGAPVDIQIAPATYATRAALLTAVQNALTTAGLQTTAITAAIDGGSNKLVLESQTPGPNSSVVVSAAPSDASGTLTMGRAFGGKEVSGAADLRPTEGSWLFGTSADGSAVTAADAFRAEGAIDRTVELSRGPTPVRDYIGEMIFDHIVHGWDLGTAIGYDKPLPPEVVEAVYGMAKGMGDMLSSSGLFEAPVEVPDDASTIDKLVALTGRHPR